ncbi:MAG: putative maltokinase, partial [Phaeodactylibacter sp.]|nr:putative maltokinase [Phaeodactylibacter sp.]
GVRTPMQWNADRNSGFSNANPQKLFLPVIRDPLYRYEAVNVENQSSNPASLLWWMRNIISIRKRLRAFSHGEIEFLETGNSKILSFVRTYKGESILVVANLSKFSQALELDLKRFKGIRPVEIFSQSRFFPIEDSPYQFTMGPYGYYWFQLEMAEEGDELPRERKIEELEVDIEWPEFFENYTAKRKFEKTILPNYLRSTRWFGSKSKKIVSINVQRFPAVEVKEKVVYMCQIAIRYTDGLPETYSLPILFEAEPGAILQYLKSETHSVVSFLKTPEKEGILVDALFDADFRNSLFYKMKIKDQVKVPDGYLKFDRGKILQDLQLEPEDITSEVLKVEQSNTSVIYNGQFFFKIYRKLDTDINPDLELVRFLSEQTDFENSPRFGGGIEFENAADRSFTILGLLQNKIPNQGEAWTMFLSELGRFYEKVLANRELQRPALVTKEPFYFEDIPAPLQEFIGSVTYERVVLLGKRTAEMHIALASNAEQPDFCPERFTQNYQRSIYSGHRKLVAEKLNALQLRSEGLPAHIAKEAQSILDLREDILDCFSEIFSRKIPATKTRVHGDYHLGQVLFNGRDFYIIDFEGEPLHTISERRLKKTPFKDVAGMIRSFHYAAYGQLVLNQNYRQEDMPFLEGWASQWFHYIRQVYLTAYLEVAQGQSFVPKDRAAMKLLLRNYTLEKAIYEVGYEMNARPDWLRVPIRGVLYAMEEYFEETGQKEKLDRLKEDLAKR